MEEEIKEIDNFNWKLPECCEQGWSSCPHVVRPREKVRYNRGL